MKSVEILLRDNVEHVGKVGDVVKVAAGYARNYLFPMGLAILATPENVALMARRRARQDAEEAARNAHFIERVEALSAVTVETTERADETGSLYGSVSAAQVAELLVAAGQSVEEKDVRLEAPIKSVGEHEIQVHVHGDMNATVKLTVNALQEA